MEIKVVVSDMQDDGKRLLGFVFEAVGTAAMVIAMYVLLCNINVKMRYKLQNELLEKYNTQQKEYFEHLLEKEEQTRRFRHDLIAQFVQLQHFAKEKEYDRLEHFIEEATLELTAIRNTSYDVGNEIMNVIFNYYLLPKKEQYPITVRGYCSEELGITDRDICIVLSNLITNAIEALEQVEEEKRYLSVYVNERNNYFLCVIENAYCPKEYQQIKSGRKTTKKDKENHGFGTQNIRDTVGKYDGANIVWENGTCFRAEVRMGMTARQKK